MYQSQIEKYKTDLKDYKIVKQINNGTFGIVYEVKNLKTDKTYAAKVILNSNNDQYKEMINRELGIMMRVTHPTLIGFRGFSLVDFNGMQNITILMDYIELGSLSDVLNDYQNSRLSENYDNTNRQIILVGIAYGMMQLHQKRVIHRDLKPENILIDSNYYPHISDFGLSKILEIGHSKSQSKPCGTMIYMAPEVMKGSPYDGKADVYSFSIIMYQVLTDSVPYPLLNEGKISDYQFQYNIIEKNVRPEFPTELNIKESLKNLVKKCWSPDPKERPTFEEIFNKLAYSKEYSIYESIIEDDNKDDKKYYLDDVDENALEFYIENVSNNDNKIGQDDKKLNEIINEYQKIILEKEKRIKELENQNKTIQEQNNLNSKRKIQEIEDENDVDQENRKLIQQLEEKNKTIQEQNTSIQEKDKLIQQLEEQNKKLMLQLQNQQNQIQQNDSNNQQNNQVQQNNSNNQQNNQVQQNNPNNQQNSQVQQNNSNNQQNNQVQQNNSNNQQNNQVQQNNSNNQQNNQVQQNNSNNQQKNQTQQTNSNNQHNNLNSQQNSSSNQQTNLNSQQKNQVQTSNSNEVKNSGSETNQTKKVIIETKVITKEPAQSKVQQQSQPKQADSNQQKKQIQQRKPVQETKTLAKNSSQTKPQTKSVSNQPKKATKPAAAAATKSTSSLKSATLIKPSVSAGVLQSSKMAKTTGPFTKVTVVKTTKKKQPFGPFEEAQQEIKELIDDYANLE